MTSNYRVTYKDVVVGADKTATVNVLDGSRVSSVYWLAGASSKDGRGQEMVNVALMGPVARFCMSHHKKTNVAAWAYSWFAVVG